METQRPRRQFLKALGAGAAGLVTAGYTATSRGYGANETLNIACIGTGGRCRHLMGRLNRIEGVRTVAVCDVWDVHLEAGRKLGLSWVPYCRPEAATVGQVRDVVVAYLKAHPESRHGESIGLIVNALLEAWPCPEVK